MKSTLVTYFPPKVQKQLLENQKNIQGKPYEKYFNPEMEVPVDLIKAIQFGPQAAEKTFPPTPENLNRLYADLDNFPNAYYGAADDGENGLTTFNICRHFFPGVTVKMMQWWFTWHVLEKERYSIWFPYAHLANTVVYPERMTNPDLSYEEKLYGNPNHIVEYIGNHLMDAVIHFTDPTQLGLDKALLEKQNLTFSASGWSHSYDTPEVPNALMLHIGRDVEGGFELYTCYFIGAHTVLSQYSGISGGGERGVAGMKSAGITREFMEDNSYEMAVHDITEFTRLGSILPQLYAEFGPK